MVQHNSDNADEGSKAKAISAAGSATSEPPSNRSEPVEEVAPRDAAQPHADHEPGERGRDGGEPVDLHDQFEPVSELAPTSEPPTSHTKTRKGLTFGRLLLALIIIAAAVVGGAFAFRDKDERLRAIADSVEQAIQDPQALIAAGQAEIAGLFGGAKQPPTLAPAPEREAVADGRDRPSAAAPASSEKEASAPSAAPLERQAAPSKPSEPAPQPMPRAREEHMSTSHDEGARASEEARRSDRDALVRRIDQLEQIAQSALRMAEEARAGRPSENGEKAPPASAPMEEREYLTALEGRIDELASEIRAVRERLDAPKSEMRAPQEAAEVRGQAAPKKSVAELVVVAQSLNHELEKGKPYSVELAALTTLGVDSELLAALAPAAERGALTPAQLLEGFGPVAKRLRALDAPKSTGSYVEHLARSFGRLVRVRPASEAPSLAVSDHVDAIETALKHGDVTAAAESFDKLPDNAKTEESAFGELLRQRRDAEKAAASILSGAIAALGRNKS